MYDLPVSDFAAFVLAGGKSTRMGTDKAFLGIGSTTLLERALRLVGRLTDEVRIVGPVARFAKHGTVVEDVFPERGPLSGIHAALAQSECPMNLMMAVDLPYISFEFLRFVVSESRKTSAMVVVPQIAGHLHPLCGIYRREFVRFAEAALSSGRNRIDRVFDEVEIRVLGSEELNSHGFSEQMFHNVNTREDWESARANFTAEAMNAPYGG